MGVNLCLCPNACSALHVKEKKKLTLNLTSVMVGNLRARLWGLLPGTLAVIWTRSELPSPECQIFCPELPPQGLMVNLVSC